MASLRLCGSSPHYARVTRSMTEYQGKHAGRAGIAKLHLLMKRSKEGRKEGSKSRKWIEKARRRSRSEEMN